MYCSAWHGKRWLCKEVGWRSCPTRCTHTETLALLPDDCFVLHVMFSERASTVSLVGGRIRWMEKFDFLFCIKEESILEILHGSNMSLPELSLVWKWCSTSIHVVKWKLEFILGQKSTGKKKFAVTLWDTLWMTAPFWIAYLLIPVWEIWGLQVCNNTSTI